MGRMLSWLSFTLTSTKVPWSRWASTQWTLLSVWNLLPLLLCSYVAVCVGPSGYLGIGLADPAQCRTHNIGGICVGSVIDGSFMHLYIALCLKNCTICFCINPKKVTNLNENFRQYGWRNADYVCHSLCVGIWLCLHVSLCGRMSVSVSMYLCVSVSIYLCICVSLSIFMCLCIQVTSGSWWTYQCGWRHRGSERCKPRAHVWCRSCQHAAWCRQKLQVSK